jgi:RHS repeat-associated protein
MLRVFPFATPSRAGAQSRVPQYCLRGLRAGVAAIFNRRVFQRALSVALISTLLCNTAFAAPQIPATLAAELSAVRQELRFRFYSGGWAAMLLALGQGRLDDRPGRRPEKPAEKQSDRDAQVTRVQIFPGDDIRLRTGEPVVFSAIAYASNGAPVDGVKMKWRVEDVSDDKDKRKGKPVITHQGRFFSPIAGTYLVTVDGARFQAQARVTVTGEPQEPLAKLIEKHKPFSHGTASTREVPSATTTPAQRIGLVSPPATSRPLVAHSGTGKVARLGSGAMKKAGTQYAPALVAAAPAVQSGGDPYSWNDSNWTTADDANKERGDMPGRPEEGVGSGNFQFTAPVIGLEGRGLDLALALSYNSRVWHKAGSEITFDIDRDWPAPGWNLGFGRIVSMGTNKGFMLIDGDGTRHGYIGNALPASGWQYFVAHTIDGTLIDYSVSAYSGVPSYATAQLPNGTVIQYGAAGNNAVYPTQITDAQGNYITVTYVNNQGPNIQTISDTANRSINFVYTGGLLTEITAPGLALGTTRTLVRLNYRALTLNYNFNLTPRVRNGVVNVISAIYYPGTNTGYWFGDTDGSDTSDSAADSYSMYGMLLKVREQRGMSYNDTSGVINSGTDSREAVYEYQTAGTLSAEPTYTKLKEKWAGMDPTAPGVTQGGADNGYAVTTFEVLDETSQLRRRTTLTRPDGTKQVQYAHNNLSSFSDGLVFYRKTCAQAQACGYSDMGARSVSVTWQAGAYDSPRPAYTHAYDLPNNQYTTKLTSFEYGSYNQVTDVKEWGYDGQLKRVTKTTYENSANYTGRHIFNLAKTVEVQDANNTPSSRTEYLYDQTAPANITSGGSTVAVTHHDPSYDPYNTDQYCYPVYDEWGNWLYDDCYPVFNSATNYRGNVTTIKRFADAAGQTGLVSETRAYDKTGNLITASTACCEQTSFIYDSTTAYTKPVEQWRGSATNTNLRVRTRAQWNSRTGLVEKTWDADDLMTETQYYSDTLRPQYVHSRTGAYSHHIYDDAQMIVYDRLYFTDDLNGGQLTLASGTDTYLDGLGRAHGEVAYGRQLGPNDWELDVVNTKFDALGRVWKQTRPYRYGLAAVQIPWTLVAYDALDRVTETTAPDGSVTKRFYDEAARPSVATSELGNTIRAQDQWGRERWARADWGGRLIEVVEPEPDPTTNFGSVLNGTGYRTTYQYDLLNNLTETTQGEQQRKFKYDGLSRLTHQKLAEREATLSDTGGTGTLWSDFFKYDERSNLTERVDARHVKTIFDYQDDPLNRLKEIRYVTTSALNTTTDPLYPTTIHATPKITYEYETAALRNKTRLTRVTVDGFVTDDLTYDTNYYYRLTGVTRTFSGTTGRALMTNYLYDKADRVREVTYPAQWPTTTRRIARYGYDEASRFKQIDYDGSGSMQSYASGIIYNAESQATSLKVGYTTGANEVKEFYTYSLQTGLITNQQVQRGTSSPTTLLDLSYDYTRTGSTGVTGQLTKIINNNDATKNRFYEYDALARLKRAKGGTTGADWQQEYAYDRYGNRTLVTKTGSAPLDAVDTGGQTSFSLSFTAQGQTLSNRITTAGYVYDKAGNLTRGRDKAGQWRRYEYDAANRLKAVKDDAGTIATYDYGASNQRLKGVEGTSPVTTTWYVWEGGQVVAEYDAAAINWRQSYVYLGERLLAVDAGGTLATQFYHPDRLGTRLVTNASDGSPAGEQESLPFGTGLGAGAAGTRRFTSYDRSGTTTLDYAENRFYSAGVGRFTQVDPIGMGAASLTNPQSLNLYAYCENDPINRLDPEGLSWRGFFQAIGNFFKRLFGGGPGRPRIKLPGVTTPPFNPNAGVPSFGGFGGGSGGLSGGTPPFNPNARTGVSGISSFLDGVGDDIGEVIDIDEVIFMGTTYIPRPLWDIIKENAQRDWDWVTSDGLAAAAGFFAGFGDALTFGATGWVRRKTGSTDSDEESLKESEAYRVGTGGGAALSVVLPGGQMRGALNASRLGHIFRSAAGHVNPRTLATQERYLRVFEKVASNPANFRYSRQGNDFFTQTFRNGKQVWVELRNGQIRNAGVNLPGAHR